VDFEESARRGRRERSEVYRFGCCCRRVGVRGVERRFGDGRVEVGVFRVRSERSRRSDR
jgi:hypothetical protein